MKRKESSLKTGMISLDHHHWQRANRLALEIHATSSRDGLVRLATEGLPIALEADHACWTEHDTVSGNGSEDSGVLGLILAMPPVTAGLSFADHSEPHRGVFDLFDLAAGENPFVRPTHPDADPHAVRGHQLFTGFSIEGDHGVLLTVSNARPFSMEQKTTLALLRDHFVIAIRRHGRRDSPDSRWASIAPGGPGLSRREKEVLPCLLNGMTNPEIATRMGISPRTVEKHVASILEKAGIDNRRQLISLKIPGPTGSKNHKNG
jgi:DNA-binding CsgD family transcriptional regulator